ncbi:MAG: deiodinase-like protein [Planctomycetota bacterium]
MRNRALVRTAFTAARRRALPAVFGLLGVAACSSPQPAPPPSPAPAPPASAPDAETAAVRASGPVFPKGRPGMAEAAATFDKNGVQPGERLPPLSLVDLDGKPVDLAARTHGKPLVLVTCSLTCNVARRQQATVARLRERAGDSAHVLMVYTIDAHPAVDPCPYTGDLWVPPANEGDGVLVRQPTDLAGRLALARRYAAEWAAGTPVVVDTMDDASWHVLGRAPNLGLIVDRAGVVVARCGWFDIARIEEALQGR